MVIMAESLKSFDISKETGFLPEKPPLTSLSLYFNKWEVVASQLSELLQKKQLRKTVHQLPVLEFSEKTLHSDEEWQRALVVLSFLFQGYMWQEGLSGLPSKMPSVLSVPFYTVTQKIGVAPIGLYAGYILYNWYLKDPERPLSIDNLHSMFTFTGTEDESWFYMIFVQIELDAVPAINAIWEGIAARKAGNTDKLISSLAVIAHTITTMLCTLKRMTEKCDPQTFYVKIRPYFVGTKGLNVLPNGMIYEGVDSKPRECNGSSAGQTTVFQAIDHFIGVQHYGPEAEFLDAMQNYMPRKHREFLQYLSQQVPLRQHVIESRNKELIEHYNATVEALVKFRSHHVIVVTRYMVNQRSHCVDSSLKTKGAGGTLFMSFLKNVRDNTKAAIV